MGARTPRLIALTGYGLQGDLVKGRAAGFEEYLVKPVDANIVLHALQAS
jgi:CheY-like chemotaxis protein